jgi:predicted membrane protein
MNSMMTMLSLTLVYGSPFIFAIVIALPPALRERSWKTFGLAVLKSFFGIVIPLLVFVLSCLYQTSSKAECHHNWWACFMWTGKIPLLPFLVWAVAALFVHDINRTPNRDRTWVTTGIFMGTLTTVLMAAYLLFMGIGKALTHNPWLIVVLATTPFYMSIWGTIRTYQFWRQGVLKLQSCLTAALVSIPFWICALFLSKKIYASLPENSGCFVVTAAMRGHEVWVGPFTTCPDRGALFKANRQLLIFWQFEALWETRMPRSHRLFRQMYNRLGPRLARLVISPWIADAFYLALKPAEWAARLYVRKTHD